MPIFAELPTLAPLAIWDGVVARTVESGRLTLAVVELEPGTTIPEHRHANEQVGLLLSGSLSFRAGDETCEAVPGTTWAIPPDVPHSVTVGPRGAVVVEVFAPRRDDWADVPPAEPAPPVWP